MGIQKNLGQKNLLITLPAAGIGILIGTATFSYVDENSVRLLLGAITLVFSLNFFFKTSNTGAPKKPNWIIGVLAGVISGFTSFVAHAGGPRLNFICCHKKWIKLCCFSSTFTVSAAWDMDRLEAAWYCFPGIILLDQLCDDDGCRMQIDLGWID